MTMGTWRSMYLKDMVKDLDVTEHVDHLEWYESDMIR